MDIVIGRLGPSGNQLPMGMKEWLLLIGRPGSNGDQSWMERKGVNTVIGRLSGQVGGPL